MEALRVQGRLRDPERDDMDGFTPPPADLLVAAGWVQAQLGEGRRVVINCAQGRSQSGAAACAWLMASRRISALGRGSAACSSRIDQTFYGISVSSSSAPPRRNRGLACTCALPLRPAVCRHHSTVSTSSAATTVPVAPTTIEAGSRSPGAGAGVPMTRLVVAVVVGLGAVGRSHHGVVRPGGDGVAVVVVAELVGVVVGSSTPSSSSSLTGSALPTQQPHAICSAEAPQYPDGSQSRPSTASQSTGCGRQVPSSLSQLYT